MMKWIVKWWPWLACILFWVVVAAWFRSCDNSLRRENKCLRHELAVARQYVPLQRDTIRDTVEVVTQKTIEVEKVKEVLTKEDKQLLKDLSLKASELESYQKMSNVIHDTVTLIQRDSLMEYHDAWTDFTYSKEGLLSYRMRDSLAIAVERQPKHRFLFFRWGTKGYKVKIANHNPHASLRYNTFVKRRR